MTHFEMMLLGRIDALTTEVGRMATAVARLEERQISQDDRLEELERTPPPAPARASAAPGRSRWCITKDVGVTGAAIVALVTAIAQAVHAPPPAPPPAPRPPVASGAGPQ